MASLIVVNAAVVLFSDGTLIQSNSSPYLAALHVKLALGVFLIYWGFRVFANRKKPPKPPSWMKKIDSVHGVTAVGLGIILQPWVFVAAGADIVLGAQLKTAGQIFVLMLFVLLASVSFLTMLIYTTLWIESTAPRLERI